MPEDKSSEIVKRMVTSKGTLRLARPVDKRNNSQYVFRCSPLDMFGMSQQVERALGLGDSHTQPISYARRQSTVVDSRQMSIAPSDSLEIAQLAANLSTHDGSGSGISSGLPSGSRTSGMDDSCSGSSGSGQPSEPQIYSGRSTSSARSRAVNIVEPDEFLALGAIEKVHQPELSALPKHGIIKTTTPIVEERKPPFAVGLESTHFGNQNIFDAKLATINEPIISATEEEQNELTFSQGISSSRPISVQIHVRKESEEGKEARKEIAQVEWRKELPRMFGEMTHLYSTSYRLGTRISADIYEKSFIKTKPEDAEQETVKGSKGKQGGKKESGKQAGAQKQAQKATTSRQSSRSNSAVGTRPQSRISRASPSGMKA